MSNKKLEIYLFALIEHIQALPQPIPCFKEQAAGGIFVELTPFFSFEDAEGFAREICAINILWLEWIENIAKFVTLRLIQ
jgi:hypothetical protein